MQQYLLFIKM